MKNRSVIHLQHSEPVTDGDGVKIQRSVARKALQTFDPFLLLDEIASDDAADYIGGFPEHPHRGFETVTYMLEGKMEHRDHMGNVGTLESGGVQWMTAGRGVLHSELPLQEQGRLHGFQLWVNLPAKDKMTEPNYREYSSEQIPVVSLTDRSQAKVIAGSLIVKNKTVFGPIKDVSTDPDYFDLYIAEEDTVSLSIDANKQVIVYVYQGEVQIEDKNVQQQQLAQLSSGDKLEIHTASNARLLVIAGNQINEPVANWGPFVMNTREEVEQAISDYRNGVLV